ncbi:AAA-like domain-containing protein [Candidatus Parabeggiatoa sp. HSG14]|uniref:AAA-like domain-containing protein n=1 Tax=Candidatus Parabeggiatoa sp. HSG14 TaxID=3055593 RepID=UPI0025A922FE|nr:AAA-like domain-containing protein [Thiotrichales bacterium HSG14]
MSNQKSEYTIGGNVSADNKMYVVRQADQDLYKGLKSGEFCYVLNARQMGKSSLRVRVARRLQAEGMACVNVDVTEIGSQETTQKQWYAGIIDVIADDLHLTDFDVNSWWEQHDLLSPVQHLSKFFDKILSERSENIIIFVDESDGIRRFGQDFFALIRACYNRRSDNSAYNRLTFAILGVASPGDLIADRKLTPFNIGVAIELAGFQLHEAMVLADGLGVNQPEKVLQIVLEWTGGQPFLTQKLCDIISKSEALPDVAAWIEQLVRTEIVKHWESQDEPMHLRNISGRILHEGGQKTGQMLGLYQRVLREDVLADDSREQLDLRLSGLVVKYQNKLLVYNKIYALVFDNDWINNTLAKLRPYAESFNGWQDSGKSEAYLLRGQAFEQASAWAEDKNLSEDDHSFLNACRQLAEREVRKALRAKVQRQMVFGLALFLSVTVGLALWAFVERQSAVEAKQQAIKSEQKRTKSLFDSHLTHASLLARGEDYAAAKEVLKESRKLDSEIIAPRRHARNLLAGFTEIMGGAANKVYEGAGAALLYVAVSPDGKLLATAGENGTLVLFDVESGELVKRLEGHDKTEHIFAVVFHPKGKWLASAGDDKHIILWSLPEGEKLLEWQAPGKVNALAVSPDGSLLASGGFDNNITLWTAETGKLVRTIQPYHRSYIIQDGLAFNSTGELLVSASADNVIGLWEVSTGEPLKILFRKPVSSITWSSNDKILAIANSADNTISLWNIEMAPKDASMWEMKKPYVLRQLRGHQNTVFALRFAANGRYLVSASFDRTLRVWDIKSGATVRVLQGHGTGVTSIAIHDEQIFSASNDGTVRRWNMDLPHQQVMDLPSEPFSTAITPDGNSVAVGFNDGALRLYSLPDTQLLSEYGEAHTYKVARITFNAEGNLLASASFDGTAKLWQVQENKLQEQQTFTGHKNAVFAIAFSPDTKIIATASYDGQIGLFTVGTEEKRFIEKAHDGKVESVVFDSNGTRLLSSGYEDRATRLWNLNANPPTLLQEFPKAQDKLLWASLSPDNKWVASVGRGQSKATIYATQDGQEQHRLVGHESTIFRAIFSPDSQQVATVSADATVRLWDLSNGSELFSLRLPTNQGHPTPLWDFDFRCLPNKHCWIAVPLTRGKLVLYDLGEY